MRPIDQDVRDAAIAQIDQSWVLSAGAGSGKTSVLVARTANALASGIPPAAAAAITFTEKAAREMEERVRDTLEKLLGSATGERKTHLSQALLRLSSLKITTIHAFCQDLLQQEALTADWPPGAAVINEVQGASAIDIAFREWRRDFDLRHPEMALRLRELTTRKQLREAAKAVVENQDLGLVRGSAEVDWAAGRAELAELAAGLHTLAQQCQAPETCRLLAKNADLLATVTDCLSHEAHDAAVRAFLEAGEDGDKRGGRQGDWPGESREAFKDAVEDLRSWLTLWKTRIHEPVHTALTQDLEQHFLPLVRRTKRRLAQVDFGDLLFDCARMLRESDTVRARLATRFRAILVDEMQDTDPIQAEVVSLLTRKPSDEGDWLSHPPQPGHLFVVGDAKQSIYRFRRADITVWERLHELVGRDGVSQNLLQNFRSVPEIVDFVNHAFADMDRYVAQTASRTTAELAPLVLLPTEPDREIDAAIRHLHSLMRSGATVVDRDSREPRPMVWSDVMILLPAWTKAREIQDQFVQSGIACVIEGGASFSMRDEVRLMICAMRAIDEPADGEAIVAVLRGLFGLSHQRLLNHVAEGGSWRYTVPEMPAGPVAQALDVLRGLHRQRNRRGWVPLLDSLLEQTRATVVWSLLSRGPSIMANLAKLRELIRQIEPLTRVPAQVIARIQDATDDEDKDLPLLDEAQDAVRVTSLFKAKGLEAPVIVLLHQARRKQTPDAIVDRDRSEVAIKVGASLLPPGWAERKAAEDEALALERARWMYVAATRARDQLVLVRSKASKLLEPHIGPTLSAIQSPEHDSVHPIAGSAAVQVRIPDRMGPPERRRETFPGHDETVDALLAEPPTCGDPQTEARQRELAARVAASKKASTHWRSVTELARRSRVARHGGGVGAEVGQVVHDVMEHLDLGRPLAEVRERVTPLVDYFAGAKGLGPSDTEKAGQIVQRLLGHEVIDRARAATERWHEVPFAYPDKRWIVSGKIDLCFPTNDARTRWVVVDWKSELPDSGPRRQIYEAQIDLYARALLKSLTGATIEEIDKVLVGPHAELAEHRAQEAIQHVHSRFREMLAVLLDRGAPAPEPGLDVGDPVYANLELAWEEQRVGMALDLEPETCDQLESDGWQLVRVGPEDAERALEELAERLGLPA